MSKEQDQALAPEAGKTASYLIEVDPYLVAFSLNNPRRRRGLDIDSLRALADSIKAQGLAQPILVRPLPGERALDTFEGRQEGQPLPTFELVCGERRLRASRLAELGAIPMLVRDLDDAQALELQLVENIEREDLDPMEEAEGFELLRTRLGYSVEAIAERIGRGKGSSYVYKTMKLLALTPESREAMYEGHLGRSTGLLVARYPAAQQADVVAYIKSLGSGGEPAPYRLVSPHVHQRFNLVLSAAVWDLQDALLVPAAGACASCTKRTGAHGDLFGDDAGRPESCTDAQCFAGKRLAHVDRVIAEARKKGLEVIDGDEARKAMPSPYQSWVGGGYTRIEDTAVTETCDDDQEREVTYEDLLRSKGKKAPKPQVLINPHTGAAIKVIPEALADQLQAEAEKRLPPRGSESASSPNRAARHDDRSDEEKALDDYQVRRALTFRLFDAVRSRDRTDAEVLLIAKALFAGDDTDQGLLTSYLNWNPDLEDKEYGEVPEIIHAKLDAMPAADVAAVATMAAIELLQHSCALALAHAYGIDVVALRDKVDADLQRQEGADDDDEDEAESTAAEPEATGEAATAARQPTAGDRVRIKDGVRGPGRKFRKIAGREGVLLKQLGDGDWMVRCDGGKDQARVTRDAFDLLPAQADVEGDAGETPKQPMPALDPVAAWPFPIKAR